MSKLSFFESLKEKAANILNPKPSKPTSKNTPVKKEPFVYVTTKGKRFHYDLLCPGIRNSKEVKMTISKAHQAGYTACDKCCFDYLHK